jgi:hypothetical protein
MKDRFAKCGFNCGRCRANKENTRTNQDRQFCSEGWAKYFGVRFKPDLLHCVGC